MSHDPSYDVFVRWNEAAKAELGVRVQGPLLSVPGGTHHRLEGLGSLHSCSLPPGFLDNFHPHPIPDFAGKIELPTDPCDQVLTRQLLCIRKKRGRKPMASSGGWRPKGFFRPHDIIEEHFGAGIAPGLRWETVWAQYWFNRHHFLIPRWVSYTRDCPWSELFDGSYNPPGSLPYRELYIEDREGRPNFGLIDVLAGKLLDLTARIKGDVVDDGLRHPPESLPRDVQRIRAEIKQRWSPAGFPKPRKES